jgi:hypothetical protein
MVDEPERTADQQRGRPFPPGVSGNPSGRPKGTFNRATILAQTLLGREAGKIARRLIEAALDKTDPAHAVALRLTVERLTPIIRAGSIRITLPPIRAVEDVAAAMSCVVEAVAAGTISLDDGDRLIGLLDRQRIALEGPELELRLRALESAYREIANAQMVGPRSGAQPNGRAG